MTETQDEDLFPQEFRHETVQKVIRAWVSDELELTFFPKEKDKEGRAAVTDKTRSLMHSIEKYVSDGLTKEQRSQIEQSIFNDYVFMKKFHWIDYKRKQDVISGEYQSINDRIDSTNKLLGQAMIYLKGLEQKLDKAIGDRE